MTGSHKSWHKTPGEKQEHYELFKIWLRLPYEDPPKERTVRAVYRRKTGATANPSSHYFRVRDDNRWVERATDYDAHRQAQIQQAEDEAFAEAAAKIAEKEAISVERMRIEMANSWAASSENIANTTSPGSKKKRGSERADGGKSVG